ncbi:kinase-like protein [Auricularia subglabra TFB-10046 SS5]|nr:kinase-like protein [Auricularia subglabra TFB-10046 SS5]
MLLSRVDFELPPMSWDDINPLTSRDLVFKQWRHYESLFRGLGYRMFAQEMNERGELIPMLGPNLPPPADAFDPKDNENYVHIPVAYSWTNKPSHHTIRVMIDGARREVIIKLIRETVERELVEYLDDQRRTNPDARNHTIPFLQLIDTGHCVFLAMPCWTEDTAPFYSMGEAVEMLKQCLEGLAWLHEHRIAHRDISHRNIVMNFQGTMTWAYDRVKPFRSLFNVQYAIIDFNHSTRFRGDEPLEAIRTVGHVFTPPCEAPELSETVPYNPFAVDIFALAAAMQERFVLATNLRSKVVELLRQHLPEVIDLLRSMLRPNPEERPTAAAAYERVCALQAQTDPEILALHGQPEGEEIIPPPIAFQAVGHPITETSTEVETKTEDATENLESNMPV